MSSENTDGIIKESKDIGAKTFLTHFEDSLNTPGKNGQNIFYELTGLDIKMRCVGFQILDKKLKYEIRTKSLESDTSLNEILAEEDKEKYSLVVGGIDLFDVPALDNPMIKQGLQALIQQNIQKEAAAAQVQQPGIGGAPPQPGEEDQADGQQQEPQYTEADRELLKKYGDDKNVDVDEQLRKQISGESE